uniref:Hydrophobic seed protein domain-containing protein n=1 Tax=Setaria viridis TaxID=4556 RepID=A0A4U6V2V0_SETVI|nr:hypothetical protein SEVIR_4G133801v2 [Setaria viridis]
MYSRKLYFLLWLSLNLTTKRVHGACCNISGSCQMVIDVPMQVCITVREN